MGGKRELILIKDSDDEEVPQQADPDYAIFLRQLNKEKKAHVQNTYAEGSSKQMMVPAKHLKKSDVRLYNRGPGYIANCDFDKHCIFANNMQINKEQYQDLSVIVTEFLDDDSIKCYVYKLTHSTVIKNKSKMEFGLEFTNKYLKKYLEKPEDVLVSCTNNNKNMTVKMKIGERTGKAMLSAGWGKAVEKFKLKEGQIYIFSFVPCKRHVLELMPIRL